MLIGFALAIAALFLIANRGAYRGFFSADDLNNIGQARGTELPYYGAKLVNPMISRDTAIRPAAALYYHVMSRVFDLRYKPYVAAIHALHLLNVLLIWLIAHKILQVANGSERVSIVGPCAAATLFAFHTGVFAVYWAPMYVFDLLCGTFTLLTLLTYVRGRIFLSVIFFWLALKSKEIVILLPLALTAYEFWFGEPRPRGKWTRLIPFFAISGVIGVQALIFNTHRHNDYSLQFTPSALWTCVRFYAEKLTLLPGAAGLIIGLGLFALIFVIKNRVLRVGFITFMALLLPMVVLPGRLFGAYLYVPLIGLAIAISVATRPVWLVIFFALWIPWNYRQLRIDRKAELAAADERRAWFDPLANFVRTHPGVTTLIYDNAPDSLPLFGITGAVTALLPPNVTSTVVSVDEPARVAAVADPNVTMVVWDPIFHKAAVMPRVTDVPYVRMTHLAPQWQLGEGWLEAGYNFRWIGPNAVAHLTRPANAVTFELVVYVPQLYIDQVHEGRIEVSLNQVHLGTGVMNRGEPSTYRFPASPGPGGPVEVEFNVTPPLKDPGGSMKLYGAPIGAFGFVE